MCRAHNVKQLYKQKIVFSVKALGVCIIRIVYNYSELSQSVNRITLMYTIHLLAQCTLISRGHEEFAMLPGSFGADSRHFTKFLLETAFHSLVEQKHHKMEMCFPANGEPLK